MTASSWRTYPLALGSIGTGTSGYSITGVLPELSTRLGMSPAACGQLVTVFALACAAAGPVVVGLTRGWPQRRVVLTALLITSVGNLATALAGSFALLVAARLFTAVGVAVYVPAATGLARAAAADRPARAAGTVITGLTIALLVGVPAASALVGPLGGYRGVFLLVGGMCLLAAAAIAMTVPAVSGYLSAAGSARPAVGVSGWRVAALLGATLLGTGGMFVVYTYLSQIPGPATHPWPMSVLLGAFGLGAVGGNMLAGRLSDRWHPAWVLLLSTVTSCLTLLVLTAAAASPATLAAIVMVWGGAAWSVYSPMNTWLMALQPVGGLVLLSLNASAVYLGMSLGGLAGGLVLNAAGGGVLPLIGAAATAAASSLIFAAGRSRLVAHKRTPLAVSE